MGEARSSGAAGGGLALRTLELVVLFVLGPAFYAWRLGGPGWLFPALWAWASFCLLVLWRSPEFSRRSLGWGEVRSGWLGPVLRRFVVLGLLLVAAVAVVVPERLFSLPLERPGLWLLIMVGYPLVSVYAQEVIFRAFFFQRYAALLPGPVTLRLASALLFGYVHIVFHNWIAVAATVVGGWLFASTFERTRSTLAASVEHALYGGLVFTVGIGQYFYSGR